MSVLGRSAAMARRRDARRAHPTGSSCCSSRARRDDDHAPLDRRATVERRRARRASAARPRALVEGLAARRRDDRCRVRRAARPRLAAHRAQRRRARRSPRRSRISAFLLPAALAEELISRGYLLTAIRDGVGAWIAAARHEPAVRAGAPAQPGRHRRVVRQRHARGRVSRRGARRVRQPVRRVGGARRVELDHGRSLPRRGERHLVRRAGLSHGEHGPGVG